MTLTLYAITLLWMDSFGCGSFRYSPIPSGPNSDALYPFVENEKVGFIDARGSIVLPPTLKMHWTAERQFENGLLLLPNADATFMNSAGKTVIDLKGYRADRFFDGLAAVQRIDNGLVGFINTKGEFQIPPKFKLIHKHHFPNFSEGLALVEIDSKFGYADQRGQMAIAPIYRGGGSFSEGLAWVVLDGFCDYIDPSDCGGYFAARKAARLGTAPPARPSCRIGFVDKTGRRIGSTTFDAARFHSEGLAAVRVGAQLGFADRQGNLVIQPQFDDVGGFSEGLVAIKRGKLWGYADRTGNIIIEPTYQDASRFAEGVASVMFTSTTAGYIDRQGKPAIPRVFARASWFSRGLAHVYWPPEQAAEKSTAAAYINRQGEIVFAY